MGHVRYPTAGSSSVSEAQPFFVNSPLGIYMIHNGNLTNTDQLRGLLNSSSSFFNRFLRTSSDSEVSTGWCSSMSLCVHACVPCSCLLRGCISQSRQVLAGSLSPGCRNLMCGEHFGIWHNVSGCPADCDS